MTKIQFPYPSTENKTIPKSTNKHGISICTLRSCENFQLHKIKKDHLFLFSYSIIKEGKVK